MAITQGQNGNASDFINAAAKNVTPANDDGKVAKLESNAKVSPVFVSTVLAKQLTPQSYNGGSSTAESTIFSATIPVGLLATANGVRFKAFLDMQSPGSTSSVTIRLKLGSTTVVTLVIPSFSSSAHTGGPIEIVLFNNGGTGAQYGFGYFDFAGKISTGTEAAVFAEGTGAEATTSSKTLTVTVQPTGALPTANSGTVYAQTLEVL